MGLITNLANPKIAVIYLSLLPQFITPGHGSVVTQSVVLDAVQICISLVVNAAIAGFLTSRPGWVMLQRWMMGGVLTGLAVKMASEGRK